MPGSIPNLLPSPREIRLLSGIFVLPNQGIIRLDPALPRDSVLLPAGERLAETAREIGSQLEVFVGPMQVGGPIVDVALNDEAPGRPGGYLIKVGKTEISIRYHDESGLRSSIATLRQLLRENGRRLPCLRIRDWPDFARRGVMLDVSRGRVPKVETLIELTDHLADFKINEFQLYIEHTFAYRNFDKVWKGWSPLTGKDILRLDAHCRRLGIDLVPNQNSLGHLRHWFKDSSIRKLAEVQEPWPDQEGAFLRYPSTLAPTHPGTLPFLRRLYDELLPHFTSARFNVGCDEPWDLGRGQSKPLCDKRGAGRVYVDFLKQIHRELAARGKQMMVWGDIVVKEGHLARELPKDVIVLNWGYEAGHPFQREGAIFARTNLTFYVCPGTSTWMSLIGRHDNAFANLEQAARAGRKHGASGYLIADWGDGGHPQPLAVSYAPYLVGAAACWGGPSADPDSIIRVLSRDVFHDPSKRLAKALLTLGFTHQNLGYFEPNLSPLGAVIAAPPLAMRELVCRDGLKYYARIPGGRIRSTLAEIESQLIALGLAQPQNDSGRILLREAKLAARMAAASCKYMQWQQMVAAGRIANAQKLAKRSIREIREIQSDSNDYWPMRNKGTTAKCSAFLQWRIEDYQSGVLHFQPDVARKSAASRDSVTGTRANVIETTSRQMERGLCRSRI